MADSTQSDQDKIRAKRLAKLGGGGGSSNNSSTTSPIVNSPTPNGAGEASQQQLVSPPATSPKATVPATENQNPFNALGLSTQQTERKPASQVQPRPRPASPAKRERDGSEKPARPRQSERSAESLESWQDKNLRSIFRVTLKPNEKRDVHGHDLIYLGALKDELQEQQAAPLLDTSNLEGAITEAMGQRAKPFEYILACFKRASRALRSTKLASDDPKHDILVETRRMCMSYCVFAVTMPSMFVQDESAAPTNPLVDHLLADPECDTGICSDFLEAAIGRMNEEDGDMIKEVLVGAAEELSSRLLMTDMLGDYQAYVRGLRNLLRFKPIAVVITESPMFVPEDIEPQDIETKSLLGPFYRLSPMQPSVAQSYFSAPKTRDRAFIANAQGAVRMTLRTHQEELFAIADAIVRAGPAAKERMLDWFALCVNKNHKKRAMRVDYKVVSSDGFMVNVTNTLDLLCDPFMDARFGKIERIDANYFRRNPRVDISDETKINVDQKTADEFYAVKAEGTSNFISECFFLTVAAHHYGTEAAQTRMTTMRKTVKRYEQDLNGFEADRHKYINDPRYLARFEEQVTRIKKTIDDMWSTIHATHGVLLDDVNQTRSMQFMRYVIVWLLRLASGQDLPKEQLRLPLPAEEPEVFKCLPEYFLEDIVDNFKFITSNIPHIITPQQCDEIVQVCIAFLRSTEYVKNPGVKSGLVTILFYGVQPYHHQARGVLGDLLIGSSFAHKHLLHALMKFYIEAEMTGTHTQFYDKFNIRYEIFQVIKCIWANTMYRENLSKEAQVNTDFFVQFVNMIVNDVTFVLDESLTSFTKIHELSEEAKSPTFSTLTEEERKEKMDLLEEQKGKAKSYMGLTREAMETLTLFTEALPVAFTMPEIVQRLADMLDYNLDIMVGERRKNLIVETPQEYGFHPKQLLADFVGVYINLAEMQSFIQAIARDLRSYKPQNFEEATVILTRGVTMKSPEEMRVWTALGGKVAQTRAEDEQEEEDMGEAPDEFTDPLMATLMEDPVILPTSRTVIDRATIRSHLLSDPTDPFNRSPLKIEDVIPDTDLKRKIEEWKAEKKAAKAAEKANAMDTS